MSRTPSRDEFRDPHEMIVHIHIAADVCELSDCGRPVLTIMLPGEEERW